MENSGWNMYVFRDGRKTVSGESVRRTLLDALREFVRDPDEDKCLAALIASGELECALADAESESAVLACEVTDEIARAFAEGRRVESALLGRAAAITVPQEVRISVAEGFAYYALHPQKLITLIEKSKVPAQVRVVGLRSIGTTLSAVVAAALRAKGIGAERITVRPQGHPYERQLQIDGRERDWLLRAGPDSQVIIVDEGPGISGSSFLATAEAVESAGIDRERIVLIGSREPDIAALRAPNASERWQRFRYFAVDDKPILPDRAQQELGGGLWRRLVLTDFENQPACWPQLESSKYLSSDQEVIFKFHGYGHYGEQIEERARKLAEAGFGTRTLGSQRGFGLFEFVRGQVMNTRNMSPAVLKRLAEYCAFRQAEFGTEEQPREIEAMTNWNWECEFGEKLEPHVKLEIRHRVIADGRMLPHEWLLTDDGRVVKTDGVSHGDDHFFPGPCDIAWDVAGAIVEWDMDDKAATEFVDQYRVLSGDDVRDRLPEYVLAYSIFRMAWSKMAAHASAGQFDESLLMRDYQKYRIAAMAAEKDRVRKQATAKVAS